MSKKDYELIARTLAVRKPEASTFNVEWKVWTGIVGAIASALASTSERFDRERFERACYEEGE